MIILNVAIATLLASATASFASQSLQWVGGEIGFVEHNTRSAITRAKVMQNYKLSFQNKVDGSAGIQLGGDGGYLELRHFYAIAGGKIRHTDKIFRNTAKPDY